MYGEDFYTNRYTQQFLYDKNEFKGALIGFSNHRYKILQNIAD